MKKAFYINDENRSDMHTSSARFIPSRHSNMPNTGTTNDYKNKSIVMNLQKNFVSSYYVGFLFKQKDG